MAAALGLARRGLGNVAPNPAVGCILVRDGMVVGRGWTQAGGRPHAEVEALARAGEAARGATAYVTLEPCAHWGRTGPCAEALARAGVARVVAATVDPDPRVAGKGFALLARAGVAVATPCLEAPARALNAGFFSRLGGRPHVLLKLATSLDGRIATEGGDSRWITGEAARRHVHLMRARADAIMVGAATAATDDPDLTCRLPGLEGRSPHRYVVDTAGSLPLTARVVAGAHAVPTTLLAGRGRVDAARAAAFRAAGVTLAELPVDGAGMVQAGAMLAHLAQSGVTRLMVEGGGRLAASLLKASLVDRIAWFRGGVVIGGDGRPSIGALGLKALRDAGRFRLDDVVRFGDDLLESYIFSA